MKKRPLSIVLIAIFYILEPIGTMVHAAYINQMPLWGSHGILSHLLWSDWIILGLFPVVGVGVYMVRKWGWYLFLAFSLLLIFYNLFVYKFLNPNYSFSTVMLFIIITTVISAFFLRRNVYAPFFNPRLRWWEIATRYRVPLNTVLLTKEGAIACKTVDISETGCFVDTHEELPVGSQVMLEFRCDDIEINCLGKVVHHRSGNHEALTGYGIMFQAISKEMKQKIRQMLWYYERIGLEDRKNAASTAEIPAAVFRQGYTVFDQMGFRVKFFLRGALGFR